MDRSKLIGLLPEYAIDQLEKAIAIFPVLDTPICIAHFIGQCSHESGHFKITHENLNYSQQGLVTTFHKYFQDLAVAANYAHQPEKIANRVYANRMGNGDEQSGDGWKHRGMGYIQITGKNNQEALFKYLGLPIDTDPSLIESEYPMISAAWFFEENNLWAICEKGTDIATCTILTRHINGGTIGLQERYNNTTKAYQALMA